jgi:hypothetical protein
MIHWVWLILSFIAGAWLGSLTSNKTSTVICIGIIGTLAAIIGF